MRKHVFTSLSLASLAVPSFAAPEDYTKMDCPPWWFAPPKPENALAYNGITTIKPACFNQTTDDPRPHTVYIIGDWGGVLYGGVAVAPADRRDVKFKAHHRDFVNGADDVAQRKVADQMRWHSERDRVDYILNVGDNFYWGGLDTTCGQGMETQTSLAQWQHVYELMYQGGGLDNKQWLGVLGNHDYGGWNYLSAWDQMISYTWGAPGTTWRWFTPALYYKTTAIYEDFSIDYFFVDTNVWDAFDPYADPMHNICGIANNPKNEGCQPTGPYNVWQCKWWFINLWNAEKKWMEEHIHASTSDWQIVVTHFPPNWGADEWKHLCNRFGIDLIIAGHVHNQQIWAPGDEHNFLGDTAVVISGGGGGITSENLPNPDGWDDEYGFVKMEVHKREILLRHVSHGGIYRKELRVYQRQPVTPTTSTTSSTTTVTSTSTTVTTTSTVTQSWWNSDNMLKLESELADLLDRNGTGALHMDFV